jgi:hypothetical protein
LEKIALLAITELATQPELEDEFNKAINGEFGQFNLKSAKATLQEDLKEIYTYEGEQKVRESLFKQIFTATVKQPYTLPSLEVSGGFFGRTKADISSIKLDNLDHFVNGQVLVLKLNSKGEFEKTYESPVDGQNLAGDIVVRSFSAKDRIIRPYADSSSLSLLRFENPKDSVKSPKAKQSHASALADLVEPIAKYGSLSLQEFSNLGQTAIKKAQEIIDLKKQEIKDMETGVKPKVVKSTGYNVLKQKSFEYQINVLEDARRVVLDQEAFIQKIRTAHKPVSVTLPTEKSLIQFEVIAN